MDSWGQKALSRCLTEACYSPSRTRTGIIKVDRDDRISTYLENTNRTIGLGVRPKGRLIGTQSRDPKVGVLAPEPRTVLADSFEGQRLVRPNDLVIDRKGGIYFTIRWGIHSSNSVSLLRGGSRSSSTSDPMAH